MEAAQEGERGGGGRGRELLRFQLREEETVHGLGAPGSVLHGGDGLGARRLPAPVRLLALLEVEAFVRCARGGGFGGPGRAALHPLGEGGGLGVAESRLGRHLQVLVAVADGFDEEALVRLTGDDGGAGVAAFERAGAGVEEEAAFEFLRAGAVALVATLGQQGADALLEELGVLGGEGGRGSGKPARRDSESDDERGEITGWRTHGESDGLEEKSVHGGGWSADAYVHSRFGRKGQGMRTWASALRGKVTSAPGLRGACRWCRGFAPRGCRGLFPP